MGRTKGKQRVATDAIKALDSAGKEKFIGLDGINGDALKTLDENNLLLKEVVKLLQINNKILNEVHDLNVNEQDIRA